MAHHHHHHPHQCASHRRHRDRTPLAVSAPLPAEGGSTGVVVTLNAARHKSFDVAVAAGLSAATLHLNLEGVADGRAGRIVVRTVVGAVACSIDFTASGAAGAQGAVVHAPSDGLVDGVALFDYYASAGDHVFFTRRH